MAHQIVIYIAGVMILAGAVMFWLWLSAATLRDRLALTQRDHPQGEIVAVFLDEEWNPIESPTLAILVADRDGLRMDELMRAASGDVTSVTTLFVGRWRRAILLEVAGVSWTVGVITPRFGLSQGARATEETAARIRAVLGLEVLHHVLDRRDELPHV